MNMDKYIQNLNNIFLEIPIIKDIFSNIDNDEEKQKRCLNLDKIIRTLDLFKKFPNKEWIKISQEYSKYEFPERVLIKTAQGFMDYKDLINIYENFLIGKNK